jgi:hypothetical protein
VVRIAGQVTVGGETQPLAWDSNTGTKNPYVLELTSNPNAFNLLTTFTATVRLQDLHPEREVILELQVYVDNLYIPADHFHSDGFSSLYITALDATFLCSTSDEGNLDTFYSTYKRTPIVFTLPLDTYEPHAFQRTTEDIEFNYSVGDPPVDPGGGWAGIYNRANYSRLLSVAGASPGKDLDPFQFTDAHKSLPSDPGMVTARQVQEKGELINLGAISESLDTYTQHLYHQREVQASRMATRVLMSARGKIQDLVLQEGPTGDDDTAAPEFGGLTVGFSSLTPAVVDEQYQGSNSVQLENTIALFPFGAILPGFVSLIPGDVGHQFTVTGGSAPYNWCLRRTRSSAADPARVPEIEGVTLPPYPFDDFGDLITGIPFPPATQGGGLPPGMLLNQDGLLYGTPTQAGVYLFRVHVKDNSGLHGEATVRFVVLNNENQTLPCSQSRGFPVTFKTTITRVLLPPVGDFSEVGTWRGKIEATGGQTGKYLFFFPTPFDMPRQSVPVASGLRVLNIGVGSGQLALSGITSGNFNNFRGVWVFDMQATEVVTGVPDATCDVRAVALSIGTTQVAGMADGGSVSGGGSSTIPEGGHQEEAPSRPYLILDPPVPVKGFIQGKNVYLQGNPGLPLRPDLGGININPGIVTSVNPGSVNPVRVIGIGVEESSPSFYHLDWMRSNPVTFFREMVDRFDPVPLTPPPPGQALPPGSPPLPDVDGSSIDDMIPVGKRIRPLWPV